MNSRQNCEVFIILNIETFSGSSSLDLIDTKELLLINFSVAESIIFQLNSVASLRDFGLVTVNKPIRVSPAHHHTIILNVPGTLSATSGGK